MPILTDEERIGTTLAGKYRLDRILGKGGMGTVFGAVHSWTDREVAVKLLKSDFASDVGVVQRFLQEAKAAASLKHPNVVDVLDMGHSDDGGVYLVLEYLRGEPLGNRIDRGLMPAAEALAMALPVIEALAVAHARGIVHRDLKPDNIFLAVDGRGQLTPKLLDFGIAKVIGSSSKTGTGHIVGTPLYMSPEQVRGQSDLGAASDVWSMGVVLFECLTGKVPFNAGTPTGVLMAIVTTAAPSVASVGVEVPAAIAAVVDRALVADLGVRFRDARELGEALHAAGLTLPATQRAASVAATVVATTHVAGVPTGEPSGVTLTGDTATSRSSTTTPVAWTSSSRAEVANTVPETPRRKIPSWLFGAIALLAVSGAAGVGGRLIGSFGGGSDASPASAVTQPTTPPPPPTPTPTPEAAAPGAPTLEARAADVAALAPDAGTASSAGEVVGEPGVVAQTAAAPHTGSASAKLARVLPGARPRVLRPAATPTPTSPPVTSDPPRPRTPPPTGANGAMIID